MLIEHSLVGVSELVRQQSSDKRVEVLDEKGKPIKDVYWQVHLPRTWDPEKNVWVWKRRTFR